MSKREDKAFREKMRQEEAEEKEQRDKEVEALKKVGSKLKYNAFLATILAKKLELIKWPDNWSYKVGPTEVGVVMEVRSPTKFFRTAFGSTSDGIYDLNAIDVFALRAENTLEKQVGIKRTASGIIIP